MDPEWHNLTQMPCQCAHLHSPYLWEILQFSILTFKCKSYIKHILKIKKKATGVPDSPRMSDPRDKRLGKVKCILGLPSRKIVKV